MLVRKSGNPEFIIMQESIVVGWSGNNLKVEKYPDDTFINTEFETEEFHSSLFNVHTVRFEPACSYTLDSAYKE